MPLKTAKEIRERVREHFYVWRLSCSWYAFWKEVKEICLALLFFSAAVILLVAIVSLAGRFFGFHFLAGRP